MIFMSKTATQAMSEATTIYADGTFVSIPLPFGRANGARQGQFYVLSG